MDTEPPQSPSSSEADPHHLQKKSRTLASGKVCIVCACMPEGSNDNYNIYIVDSDSESVDESKLTDREPTLRLERDLFYAQAFCVLRSTLYILEGRDQEINPEGGKSLFMYELPSSGDVFNLRLDKSVLIKVDDEMHHTKIAPVATPTPDGKILVFSTIIRSVPPAFRTAETCDFELFDAAEKSWHKLPGLCDGWGDGRNFINFREGGSNFFNFRILAYGFINHKPTLLLRTEVGMFTLDLQPPYNWARFDGFPVDPRLPLDNSFLLVGDFCLTPYAACDVGEKQYFLFPELSSSFGYRYRCIRKRRAITLLDYVEDRQCNFCIIQTEVNSITTRPHLTVNMYSLDLEEYRNVKDKDEDKDKDMGREVDDKLEGKGRRKMKESLPPGTRISKSFEFLLGPQAENWFFLISLFSVSA